jgi:hypothetical protein
MGFAWDLDFPSYMKQRTLSFVTANLPTAKPEDLSSLLKGLSLTDYNWRNDGTMENAIFQAMTVVYPETEYSEQKFNRQSLARSLANCIYYFGELSKQNLRKGSGKVILKKEVFESIWNGIVEFRKDFSSQAISNLLYG